MNERPGSTVQAPPPRVTELLPEQPATAGFARHGSLQGTSLQNAGYLCVEDGPFLHLGGQLRGSPELQAFSAVLSLHHYGMHRNSRRSVTDCNTSLFSGGGYVI